MSVTHPFGFVFGNVVVLVVWTCGTGGTTRLAVRATGGAAVDAVSGAAARGVVCGGVGSALSLESLNNNYVYSPWSSGVRWCWCWRHRGGKATTQNETKTKKNLQLTRFTSHVFFKKKIQLTVRALVAEGNGVGVRTNWRGAGGGNMGRGNDYDERGD